MTCALVAAALYALFAMALLGVAREGPGVFVLLGQDFLENPPTHEYPRARPGQGYDGQFFYGLALEPFTTDGTTGGLRLEPPGYRQQRILYPLLAWLLSWGHPQAAAWALVLVNWLALAALALAGGRLAQHFGRHALWGLLLACYPGYLLSFSRDLAEPLAAACMAWGLLLLLEKRLVASGAALCLSLLARETAVLLPASLLLTGFTGLWCRRGESVSVALAPLLVFACWQGVLWWLWGTPAWSQGGGNLGTPLLGIWQGLEWMAAMPLRSKVLYGAQLLCLGSYVWAGFSGLRSWRGEKAVPLAWWLYLGLLLALSGAVWREGWAFMRAGHELCLLGAVLALAGEASRPRGVALALGLPLWLALASKIVFLGCVDNWPA